MHAQSRSPELGRNMYTQTQCPIALGVIHQVTYICVITYNQILIKIHLSITFIVIYRMNFISYFVLHDCGTSKGKLCSFIT